MVEAVLDAYEKAVEAINANPDRFRPLLIEKGHVPKPVQDSFEMPASPGAGVRPKCSLLEWMTGNEMLERELAYDWYRTSTYLEKRLSTTSVSLRLCELCAKVQ